MENAAGKEGVAWLFAFCAVPLLAVGGLGIHFGGNSWMRFLGAFLLVMLVSAGLGVLSAWMRNRSLGDRRPD